MPFLAQCLFCGHKLKVPDHALGTSRQCPRCKNFFTMVPGEEALPAEKASSVGRVPAKAAIASAPRPQQVPSPGLASKTFPDRVPVVLGNSEDDGQQEFPWIEPFGLGALLLSGGALLCASSPALARLVIWLSVLALLSGLLSLLRVLVVGQFHRLFPVAGAVAGSTVLFVALVIPSFLGPVYLAARQQENGDPTAIRAIPLPEKGGIRPADPDWVDASQAALQQGRVRVQVIRVWIEAQGKEPFAQKAQAKEVLFIRLRINHEEEADSQSVRHFKDYSRIKLTDKNGKVYPQRHIRQASPEPKDRKVFPVSLTEQDIGFAAPPGKAGYLRLEIPALNARTFRFTIPDAMIQRSRGAGLAGGR
jgi:hypothetical protein